MKRKLLLTGVILLIMGLTFVACLNDDGGGHVYVPVTGVTIDQGTALSIGVGATPTLTATVAPGHASNKALTWTSSNPDVVRVITPLSGVIEAMGQGQATITATSHANRSIFGTIIITVGPAVIPTGVTVNPAILRLNLQGTKTFTLTAAVAPDNATVKTVKWSSSNPEFATVHEDTGLVTAVAAGVAVITATTVSGNRTNTSTVTVIDVPDIPVISLTVAPKTLELRPGESSSDLEAIINPFDATIQDIIWTSDNTSIVTVDAATGEVRAVVLYAMSFGCNETGTLHGFLNNGSTTINNTKTIFVEYSTDINAFSGLTSDGRPYTASAADAARWVRRNVWNWQPGAAGAWINNVWQEFRQIDMTPTEHNVFVFHLETPVRARFVRALFEQLPNPVGSTTNFQGSVWLNSFEVYNTRPDFSSGQ